MRYLRYAVGPLRPALQIGIGLVLSTEVGVVLDGRTPVLVGAGIAQQRSDDPAEADEAVALMTTAVERAGEDAHAPALLAQARAVFVPRGTWRYPDPGRIVAERVGASARSVIAELGVLQSTPFTRATTAPGTSPSSISCSMRMNVSVNSYWEKLTFAKFEYVPPMSSVGI